MTAGVGAMEDVEGLRGATNQIGRLDRAAAFFWREWERLWWQRDHLQPRIKAGGGVGRREWVLEDNPRLACLHVIDVPGSRRTHTQTNTRTNHPNTHRNRHDVTNTLAHWHTGTPTHTHTHTHGPQRHVAPLTSFPGFRVRPQSKTLPQRRTQHGNHAVFHTANPRRRSHDEHHTRTRSNTRWVHVDMVERAGASTSRHMCAVTVLWCGAGAPRGHRRTPPDMETDTC